MKVIEAFSGDPDQGLFENPEKKDEDTVMPTSIKILEVVGKGGYGVVCAAIDTHTGEKVAIKKIRDTFTHISDAVRTLREVKLLSLLRHPDIVDIKSIMLPPSRREFGDIYVVFKLMESDLHQVIKSNDFI